MTSFYTLLTATSVSGSSTSGAARMDVEIARAEKLAVESETWRIEDRDRSVNESN